MSSVKDCWDELAKILPESGTVAQISSSSSAQGNSPSGNFIILPSGDVTISECAEDLFTRIANVGDMYQRGGTIMEVLPDGHGKLHLKVITPTAFRSRIEKYGRTVAWRSGANNDRVLKPTVCPEDAARALMASEAAQRLLPPIAMIIDCPVVVDVGGEMKVLAKGYHHDYSGILVTDGAATSLVEPWTAVKTLCDLISEFEFQSPGDFARAFAILITPALKMGGIIHGHIPIAVLEADLSQAGKTFFAKLLAALYNDRPSMVSMRRGGVGSVDESFSQALVDGRPFITLDNFRGKIDSPLIESFQTASSSFPARVPHHGTIQVDPSRFVLSITSNGMEITPDLANRSCIIRIRKRQGVVYRSYPEGDLIQHVAANQSRLLGCVFSVVAEWIKQGKPKSNVVDHDFREWAQTLDCVVQAVNLGPLLADHRTAQTRLSNPAMTFVRKVAIAVQMAGRFDHWYTASDICTICGHETIEIPGLRGNDEDHAKRQVGTLMKSLFISNDMIKVESFVIHRKEHPERRVGGGTYLTKVYKFDPPVGTTGS